MEIFAKMVRSRSKGCFDRDDRGHIKGKLDYVGVVIREVREAGWVASRGDQALVWLARD